MLTQRRIKNAVIQAIKSGNEVFTESLSGRRFDCREQGLSFTVSELLPCDSKYKDDVQRSPNDLLKILKEHKVDPDDIYWGGSGIGQRTIFYKSIDEVVSAIVEGLENNSYVKGALSQEDFDKQRGRLAIAQELLQMAESSVIYWREKSNITIPDKDSGIFSLTGNMTGDLSPEIKKDIMDYLNNPTEESWENCYSYIVAGGKTLWQIWVSHDDNAPRRKGGPKWPSIPKPEDLILGIKEQFVKSKEEAAEKLEISIRNLHDARKKVIDAGGSFSTNFEDGFTL